MLPLRLRLLDSRPGLHHLRLGRRQRRLGLQRLGLQPRGVKPRQHLPHFHLVVIVHVDRLDRAGHLDADIHFIDRTKRAGRADGHHQVAPFCRLGHVAHPARFVSSAPDQRDDKNKTEGQASDQPSLRSRPFGRVGYAQCLGYLLFRMHGKTAHDLSPDDFVVVKVVFVESGVQPPPRAL